MNENEIRIEYLSNTRLEGYSSLEIYSLYISSIEDQTVTLPRNVWLQSPTEAALYPRRNILIRSL